MRTELVTTLKRKATRMLDELAEAREPILITQHGLPSAYLVDVETWEQTKRRLALLEAIAIGERELARGRGVRHAAAKKRLGKWLKSSGPRRR